MKWKDFEAEIYLMLALGTIVTALFLLTLIKKV
jgi:hypothetical protein